jgi:hypothetical protein
MSWNEELKHWSKDDDLGFPATKLSSYPRIRCTLAQVSFRLIERRAAIHVKLARGPKLMRM